MLSMCDVRDMKAEGWLAMDPTLERGTGNRWDGMGWDGLWIVEPRIDMVSIQAELVHDQKMRV